MGNRRQRKPKTQKHIINCGDCIDVLRQYFPAGDNRKGINLIYANPPHTYKQDYPYDELSEKVFKALDKGDIEPYLDWYMERARQFRIGLRTGGTYYVHCEDFAEEIKLVTDKVFDKRNYRNRIILPRPDKPHTGHDVIHCYVKLDRRKDKNKVVYNKNILSKYDLKKTGDVWDVDIPTLYEIITLLSSNKGQKVVDPMCGDIQFIETVLRLGRKGVAINIYSEKCDNLKKQIKSLDYGLDLEIRRAKLNMKRLLRLHPLEYQDYLCDMTGSQQSPKKTRDGGIDGLYPANNPKYCISVKQNKEKPVSVKDVRELIGVVSNQPEESSIGNGFLIAVSFSDDAKKEAEKAQDNGLGIYLVSLEDLIRKDYDLEKFIKSSNN